MLSCQRQRFNARHLVLICIDCADSLRVKDMHNCVSQERLLDDAAILVVPLLEGVHYFVYVNGTWNIIFNNEQGSATIYLIYGTTIYKTKISRSS